MWQGHSEHRGSVYGWRCDYGGLDRGGSSQHISMFELPQGNGKPQKREILEIEFAFYQQLPAAVWTTHWSLAGGMQGVLRGGGAVVGGGYRDKEQCVGWDQGNRLGGGIRRGRETGKNQDGGPQVSEAMETKGPGRGRNRAEDKIVRHAPVLMKSPVPQWHVAHHKYS